MFRTKRFARALIAAFLAGDILLAGLGTVGAQAAPAAHPAFIRNGICAELGDVAYPLAAIPSTVFATTERTATGAPAAHRADSSVTMLGVALKDLLTSPYAITVRQSGSETAQDIVCGDIGGVVIDGELAIGLQEMNGSGDAGLAILHTAGKWTTVTVYLVHALAAVPTLATEGITPVGVTLTDMKIAATQTSFRVGTSYAFVVDNLGATEHELAIEQSGEAGQHLISGDRQARVTDIPPGQSKTLAWTFTEPGAYVLACRLPGHFEAGMYLPIEVTAAGGQGANPGPLPPPQPVGR